MTQKILLLVSDMSIVRWILLGLPLCVLRINGFSLSVTREYQDSIFTNIQPESTRRLKCDDNNVCKCKNGLTYIFDSDSLSGKCVRDYEIIKDRSKGKLLPVQGTQECIKVLKNNKVVSKRCNENNPSVKWIWTIDGQMLNLKTLRCLKDTRTVKKNRQINIRKQFSMEQCNKSASEQKWVCPHVENSQDVRNNGTGKLWKWIKPTDASYFQKCPENIYSYKGCYRFSDGNHTKLINKARCDTLHNGTCGLKIQAPIDSGYTSCQLDWTKSTYTISGFLWYPFDGTIAGVQLNATLYPVTLQIKNISFLLSTWKGHLLRLNIKCTDDARRSESHCALLKVEGTATEEIPVSIATRTTVPPVSQTTSQITSQPRSTMFEYRQINMSSTSTPSQKLSSTNTSHPSVNSQDREENKDSSVILPIVIAAVALFCLLLALVVIVIVCKRRKRKNDDANQNEEHIYEEPHPVDNGPASPIYMEIDDITRSKSKKSNSSKKRNKSQSSETPPDPLYHTLEKPDRVEINSKKRNSSKKRNKSQSSETPPDPLYNTLEKPDHVEINDIYEELDDAPKSPNPTPQPFEKELDV